MKGFEFDPPNGRMRFFNEAREVAISEGKLINMLPSPVFDATIGVSFPDFSKDWLYIWSFSSTVGGLGGNQYGWTSQGQTSRTVVPQEWSQVANLMAVPDGCDLFWGRVNITRTGAPSHSWGGQAIDVLPPQNVWVPFNGSMLVEKEDLMARAFSIFIEEGQLKLHRQQSVGAAPGGYGAYGDQGADYTSSKQGGEWHYFSQPGLPVWGSGSSPYFKSSNGVTNLPPFSEVYTHKWDGPDPASTSDPTNYSSTYQVQVYGQFGRADQL